MVKLVKAVSSTVLGTVASVVLISAAAIALTVTVFALRVSGGTALYFLIWWTLLFAILPFGVRSQTEAGEVVSGSEPGAPAMPAMREKAVWTTLVSAVVLVFAASVLPLSGL